MNILITVIIPTRDRCHDIRRALTSIEAQSVKAIQIIVIDDHSKDNTRLMIKNEFPQVELIENKTSCGPAYLRNLGMAHARGEFLHFMDSDTELPHPKIYKALIGILRSNKNAGCIGGEIPSYLNIKDIAYGRQILINGRTNIVSTQKNQDPNALIPCDYLATLNCFVRRDVAERIGGFDQTYGFGAEDADFGLRVQRLGLKNYVHFKSAAYHHKSNQGRFSSETYLFERTRIRLIWKLGTRRQIITTLVLDLLDVITFYPVLPAKLIVKTYLKRPIRRESFTGAFILMRAYLWNLKHFRKLYQWRTGSSLNHLFNQGKTLPLRQHFLSDALTKK